MHPYKSSFFPTPLVVPHRIHSNNQSDENHPWNSQQLTLDRGQQRMALHTFPYESTHAFPISDTENIILTPHSTHMGISTKDTYPVEIFQEFLILEKEFGSYFRKADYLYAEVIYKYGGTISTLYAEIEKYEKTKVKLPQLTEARWQQLKCYIGVLTFEEDPCGQLQIYKKVPVKALENDTSPSPSANKDILPRTDSLDSFLTSFDEVLMSYQDPLHKMTS